MRLPSIMSHDFSKIPGSPIPRSSFNRSHGHKTTFDAGYLVPIYVDEALPGDTFSMNAAAFARLATPIHPIMDNMNLDTFFFAVPNRLLWDNWAKFNGEQTNPADSTDFLVPQVTTPIGGFAELSLADYMGIPPRIAIGNVNALHFRAYNLIYNEWFRDQNLQDSVTVDTTDGPDSHGLYNLLRRGKRHDYFTSCLPFPQKGDAVTLPLGSNVNVETAAPAAGLVSVYSTVAGGPRHMATDGTNGGSLYRNNSTPGVDPDPNRLYVNLESSTAATINELREAFQIQKLLERDARGGSRYTEIIKSHFGVTSPDSRLQRPEYLGGGSATINVNQVEQTAATEANQTPQGNLAAFGTSHFNGHGFTKTFDEHCVLIGMVSVRADLTYQQGVNRMWSRQDRYDYYWPSLAHIGEQAVLNKEIYADGLAADENVFGYQERFAEYRYKPSMITGQFRSAATTSLDVWHLSQDFLARPVLNSTFIQETPPIDRVIAVPSEPHFIADFYFNLRCARPMPLYSVPGLIDHF